MTIPASVAKARKFSEDLSTCQSTVDNAACFQAALDSGKSIFQQMWEYHKISRGPGKLDFNDYMMYRLWDDERFTFEQKRQFVSDSFYFQIVKQCCDPSWWILADDKFWSYTVLGVNGFPTPETQGVFCNGDRVFGGVPTLKNGTELREFFEQATYPIYSKPVHGIGSFGNFLIHGFEDGHVIFHDGSKMFVHEFLYEIDGINGQLMQTMLKPHPELAPISNRVSTVRVIVIIQDGQAKVLSTVWKIPSNDNIADNFWRDGNMLASVDIEGGHVQRLVGYENRVPKELGQDSEAYKQLMGMQLPDWNEAVDICRRGAFHFPKLKFQSWDIGLTDNGPVVVEFNPGSSFRLSQLAEDRGFLTDEFLDFLRECGCKLKTRKATK